MTNKKAIQILQQMKANMPHSPREFGEAIDYAIRKLKGL